ncbi:MAG: hypothetical protein ACRDBQ_26200 [Shewanella sp.]
MGWQHTVHTGWHKSAIAGDMPVTGQIVAWGLDRHRYKQKLGYLTQTHKFSLYRLLGLLCRHNSPVFPL